MKINNCKELWKEWMGNEETEERSLTLLEKWVFKGTQCGCVFGTNPEGIYVVGFAEGSDAELPLHPLKWGFTIDEFNEALDRADMEGVMAWNESNDTDYYEGLDVDGAADFFEPTKVDTTNMITEEEWIQEGLIEALLNPSEGTKEGKDD